ncbi:Peptidyl-trna hydrolase [Globisporangium polare]
MGNTFMSMRAVVATESFDFDEINDVDFDLVSISRSTPSTCALMSATKVAAVAPGGLCLSSSSVKPTAPLTTFAWLSWAVSNLSSLMVLSSPATTIEKTQRVQQRQQQFDTPTPKSQASFESETPAIETRCTTKDDGRHHQVVVQSAEQLPLIDDKDNLEDVVTSDTESECSGSEQPVYGNDNESAMMFAMVDNFLRKAPSSSTSSDSYAHATAVDNNDGGVCPVYSAWRIEIPDDATRCGSAARFPHNGSAAANVCSA